MMQTILECAADKQDQSVALVSCFSRVSRGRGRGGGRKEGTERLSIILRSLTVDVT